MALTFIFARFTCPFMRDSPMVGLDGFDSRAVSFGFIFGEERGR